MIRRFILSGLIIGLMATTSNAQELPAPSPFSEVEQRVGLTDFTLMYSRPGVKDRTIFGDLEAYGEVWRTGANSATKIKFSTDVTFQDKEVKAGTYSIFTIPGKEMWKVMFNSDVNATENSYDAEKNVLVVEVKSNTNSMRESLLFYFDNIRDESAELVFEWENVRWTLPFGVKAHEQAVENIQNEIAAAENNFRLYNSSARYYLDHDKDLEQALKWSKKSVEMDAKFWNVYTLSLIQNKMGKKKEAIATAKRSMELATEANYMPYVKMNKENIAAWSKK